MEYVKIDDIAKITRGVTYKKQQSSKVSKEGFIPLFRANNMALS